MKIETIEQVFSLVRENKITQKEAACEINRLIRMVLEEQAQKEEAITKIGILLGAIVIVIVYTLQKACS